MTYTQMLAPILLSVGATENPFKWHTYTRTRIDQHADDRIPDNRIVPGQSGDISVHESCPGVQDLRPTDSTLADPRGYFLVGNLLLRVVGYSAHYHVQKVELF